MTAEKYNLEVRLNIVKQYWTGPLNPDGTANEEEHGYWQTTPERLEVNETMALGAQDFLGVMQVLASLHKAVKNIKEVNGNN